MCFRGFGKSSWRRRKRFLFKVWSPSPSSSSGSELRSTAKNNPPRTASTRSRNAEKNTSVSPTGATPPPTSGLFIQSVVVVGFQEEKSGKGNVEVEVSQMSRSRKKEQNVTSFPPSIATLSADSYSYLLLPGALRRRTPVPEEWRGIVIKRESKGRHVGRRNAAGTWSASYFGGSASSLSNCRRLCCFRWPALSFKSRASQI